MKAEPKALQSAFDAQPLQWPVAVHSVVLNDTTGQSEWVLHSRQVPDTQATPRSELMQSVSVVHAVQVPLGTLQWPVLPEARAQWLSAVHWTQRATFPPEIAQ